MRKTIEELKKDFGRWEHIKNNGANDPFHPDGTNMNLVRNHIIANKRRIEEICEREGLDCPDIYYRETPLEADNRYMANQNEIRASAKVVLEQYTDNKYFVRLEQLYPQINDKDKKERAGNTLRCKIGLEKAIKEDNLVAMRRYTHNEGKNYIHAAKCFLAELDDKDFLGQISMF